MHLTRHHAGGLAKRAGRHATDKPAVRCGQARGRRVGRPHVRTHVARRRACQLLHRVADGGALTRKHIEEAGEVGGNGRGQLALRQVLVDGARANGDGPWTELGEGAGELVAEANGRRASHLIEPSNCLIGSRRVEQRGGARGDVAHIDGGDGRLGKGVHALARRLERLAYAKEAAARHLVHEEVGTQHGVRQSELFQHSLDLEVRAVRPALLHLEYGRGRRKLHCVRAACFFGGAAQVALERRLLGPIVASHKAAKAVRHRREGGRERFDVVIVCAQAGDGAIAHRLGLFHIASKHEDVVC